MKSKKRLLLFVATIGICSLFVGCGDKAETANANSTERKGLAVDSADSQAGGNVSTEVNELYQSQSLMMEMLINEDCIVDDTGDTLTVYSSDKSASVGVAFIPGIQNLGKTATLISEVLKATGAVPGEVKPGTLFGSRANHCTYSRLNENGEEIHGFFSASIINSSMYMVDVAFAPECTDADADLVVNVFSSMYVLAPVSVDVTSKAATYETKYPEAKPAKVAEKTYVPVVEWVYPPYYYYEWCTDFDYNGYDPSFYEPDWDYYQDGAWWSWDWDDDGSWGFYDEYGYWYDESYYDSYDDFYDYDPYSDPGDYYDYYDDYDPYSDPGDYYDDYSDPGDYYDDYDYSDSGDYYDDSYDSYDDYEDWDY